MELMARVCKTERMNFERLFARLFVAAGGLFWAVAVFAGDVAYLDKSAMEGISSAVIPLVIAIAALAVGWFYETLAGLLLFVAAGGAVVWGLVAGWGEAGIWWLMIAVLIAPMVIAALLFLAAARMQRICQLEE